jgi:hypothetical protein
LGAQAWLARLFLLSLSERTFVDQKPIEDYWTTTLWNILQMQGSQKPLKKFDACFVTIYK